PVYLTKNGYGTMVVMSLEQYSDLTENIEARLDEADTEAEKTDKRLSHDEVFANIRRRLNEKV
ncbi:MAG: type II toxin-antitoxin system Phd/YefM family antitoxin, partial [Ruminococcus flavefaciens]|nr:type II toxin-antitoxin system Phd/YefM family antitoxin [Ruminococcus flavefaciens]